MSKSQQEKASEIVAQLIDLPLAEALEKLPGLCGGDKQLAEEAEKLLCTISQQSNEGAGTNQPKPGYDQDAPSSGQAGRAKRVGKPMETVFRVGKASRFLFEKKSNRLVTLASLFLIFLAVGLLIRKGFVDDLKRETHEKLEAQLRTQADALRSWVDREKRITSTLTREGSLIQLTGELDSLAQADPSFAFAQDPTTMAPFLERIEFFRKNLGLESLGVFHRKDPVCLLATGETDSLVDTFTYLELRGRLFDYFRSAQQQEGTLFVPPLHDSQMIANIPENMQIGTFLSFISAVREGGEVIGYFLNSFDAGHKFSEIVRNSDYGRSNKVYAFNEEYKLVSRPRFESLLQATYLLGQDSLQTSVNNVYIKDPGGPLSVGDQSPEEEAVEQDFTEVIKDFQKQGPSGVRTAVVLDPYRDFRGIEVVGAWLWLEDLGFGLIAELDAQDAYAPVRYFDGSLLLFYLILLLLFVMIFRLNTQFYVFGQKVNQLALMGQYELLEQIGEGGFGQVFMGRHQNLKSKVAVKLLKKELSNAESIARFEKEVKITSNLDHPNTIRVYDFGTSAEGQFYYVMEYLNGISLESLLEHEKNFSVNRAIHILLHVAYSLEEAHRKKLIHRDIKPANVMLCNQGGAYDLVKVLDFGLVKKVDATRSEQTQINRIGGTPMFMAPERLRDPFNNDQRVDIYSLGALGLYMLSGRFVVELISQKMLSGQEELALDEGKGLFDRTDLPEELKTLLISCIQFEVAQRPASVSAMIDRLEKLALERPWTREEAKAWWKSYDVYGA